MDWEEAYMGAEVDDMRGPLKTIVRTYAIHNRSSNCNSHMDYQVVAAYHS